MGIAFMKQNLSGLFYDIVDQFADVSKEMEAKLIFNIFSICVVFFEKID